MLSKTGEALARYSIIPTNRSQLVGFRQVSPTSQLLEFASV